MSSICERCAQYRRLHDHAEPYCNWEPEDKTACPAALRYYGITLLDDQITDCPCFEPKEADHAE